MHEMKKSKQTFTIKVEAEIVNSNIEISIHNLNLEITCLGIYLLNKTLNFILYITLIIPTNNQ